MKFLKSIFVLVVLIATIGAGSAQTEPGAFINRLCNSTASLVAQVKSDKIVMDRYMRHFAMTENEVVNYLSALSISRVDEDNLYVVYAAPTDGPLRSKMMKLKKGTKVFVDQAGEVVLVWHCGNPVTRGPKVPYDASKPLASASGTPVEGLREVPLQAPVATMEASMSLTPEPVVPAIPEVPVENHEIPIVKSSNNLGFLGILPIIGVIRGHKSNPPVPEPASLIALGVGASVLIARRRKSN